MQNLVCEVVQVFPDKIQRQITKHCWFVSSFDDALGFVLRGDEIGSDHIIFLSDELLNEDEGRQYYTIVHEIGHVILGHKNSIGLVQTKAEIDKQEKEADDFVKKYVKSPYLS